MGQGRTMKSVLLVAVFIGTCRPAGAGPDGPARVAVLPVQTRDLPSDVAAAYRESVESVVHEVGVLELLDPKLVAARIDALQGENVYRPGCIEQMECVKRTGERLEADLLVHLEADKSIDGVRLTVRSFQAATGSPLEKEAGFSGLDLDEAGRVLRKLTLKALAAVIKERSRSTGKLVVESPQKDAELLINGKPFGKMMGKRFTVAAGVFEVLVRREGFVPFHDVVLVKPDEVEVVEAELQPENQAAEPPTGPLATSEPTAKAGDTGTEPGAEPYLPRKDNDEPPPPPDEIDTPFYKTWWFWSLVGVGVAGAGGTTAYFLLRDEGTGGEGRFEVTWQ